MIRIRIFFKKINNSMNLEELYVQIVEQFNTFQSKHEKFIEKGNKSAEADARKALGELKKLITPYRQESVEESKNLKK
jgi:uncharacterized protein YeaO (DUF488 family)